MPNVFFLPKYCACLVETKQKPLFKDILGIRMKIMWEEQLDPPIAYITYYVHNVHNAFPRTWALPVRGRCCDLATVWPHLAYYFYWMLHGG